MVWACNPSTHEDCQGRRNLGSKPVYLNSVGRNKKKKSCLLPYSLLFVELGDLGCWSRGQ